MTNNAIPRKLCEVTALAIAEANDWARSLRYDWSLDGPRGHLIPDEAGPIAVAADVVDRLNGHGYSLIPTDELHALWTENEDLKRRLLAALQDAEQLAARGEVMRADRDAAIEARDMALDLMETGGESSIEVVNAAGTVVHTEGGACDECGHVHAGRAFAGICIGCECRERPGMPA